jgi:hypothetical protein
MSIALVTGEARLERGDPPLEPVDAVFYAEDG